jgi:hypothetical protein
MCTGNGFSQVHHNGVGSVNAWPMTTPFVLNVCPAREKLLAGDGGVDESAG